MTALDTLTENGLSLGIELPLDNDLARRDVSGQGLSLIHISEPTRPY